MEVAIPKDAKSVRLSYDAGDEPSDQAYLAFFRANPDLRVERNATGEILIVPPAGSEFSHRSMDGSALSSDAAWVSKESLRRVSREQRKQFMRLCPEFVVEVLSPSDRLKDAKATMEQWIANGAHLAWLIDGDAETVYVYRKNHAMKVHRGISELAGQGPVEGFVLTLGAIWKGLG